MGYGFTINVTSDFSQENHSCITNMSNVKKYIVKEIKQQEWPVNSSF